MRFKISTLAISIAVVAAAGQVQAQGTYGDYFDSADLFIKNVREDLHSVKFFRDSHINMSYIQDYRVKDSVGSTNIDDGYEDWVHGQRFDFISGWIGGILGINYSYDSVYDLNSDHNRGVSPSDRSGNLPISGGNSAHKNYDNIGGTTQAYLKARFGNTQKKDEANTVGALVTYGKKTRHREQYSDSTSRVARAATTGADIDLNLYGTTFYATYIDGFSPRDQSYFRKGLDAGKKSVDYVIIAGLKKKFANGFSLNYEHLETQDFIKKDFAKVAYATEGFNANQPSDALAWGADFRYGSAAANGKNYNSSDLEGDQYKSAYYNANAQVSYANAYAAVGVNKVNKGFYIEEAFDGDTGAYNSSLSLEQDYRMEGERAYVADVGYNFTRQNLPGLTVHTWYASASHAKGMDGSRHEWGNGLRYNFSGDAKNNVGASVEWYNANYNAYNNQVADTESAKSYNINKVIFRYNYPFSF